MTVIIPHLIKDYAKLPNSSYNLGVADFLIKEMMKDMKRGNCREIRLTTMDEIDAAFAMSKHRFKKDVRQYEPQQRVVFIEKRKKINEDFKKLQIQHIKKFIKEIESKD